MAKTFILLVLASIFTFDTARSQWLTKDDLPGSPLKVAGRVPKMSRHHSVSEKEANAESDAGPLEAFKWYWGQRTFGLGYIPSDALRVAREHVSAMRSSAGKGMSAQSGGHYAQAASTPWTLTGPSTIGGRVNAIAIHPTDPKTIYIGGANGGVWKTTNGGAQWTPLTDQMQSLAMGAIGIDPQVPATVYAGTGEYSPAIDAYSGYGLLKSTNAGASWTSTGLLGVGAYTKIIVNPKHSNIVYAAAARGGGGVLRTTDGGGSWTRVLDSGQVSDMALSMNGDAAVLYAGVTSKAVFRSVDGGDTWTKLTHLPFTKMRRISLDASPANWKNVVVLSIDTNNRAGVDDLEGIERSEDGGNTWSAINATFKSQALFTYNSSPPQGWYDSYVRIDPSDPNHMLLGGISVWETKNGGSNWNNVGRSYIGGIHPDQHEAAFAPSSPSTVVVGNDGGVYLSNDGGSTYARNPVPLAITEYYGIGIDQTSDITYGGAQDNGSSKGSSSGGWTQFGGGDGAFAVADPSTTDRVYFCSTDGQPRFYQNGTSGLAANGINEPADSLGWINPFMVDAKNNLLYFGCQHLYSSTDKGSSWSQSSASFGFYAQGSVISAIGVFGDRQTLAVGTGNGHVLYTNDGGSNWTDMTKGLPGRFVSWVQFDPSSKSTFYVALSGYGAGHVFKTQNAGATWTNISTTLPDIPVNSLVMDPNNASALYIATDVGVFFSPNGGQEWLPYGTGLPNAAAVYLAVQNAKHVLRVGTHGRSIWEAPMVTDMPGIAMPTQRSVWAVGDTAAIAWHGFGSTVSIDISLDGGASWQSVATGASGTLLRLDTVRYSPSQNVLVKVSDGTHTVTSALFEVIQLITGVQLATVGELPYYLYDLAYDKDLNVLWGTNFSASDKNVYKIDPDAGTLLDSLTIRSLPYDPSAEGLTGIKYDPKTKHLFVQRVSGPANGPWSSTFFEITKTGTIVRKLTSPAFYGTGILVHNDTVLIADRLNSTINRASTSNYDFNGPNPLQFSRTALYGPRGLAYDSKLGQYLLAFTDFEGTGPRDAHLNDSYVLFLSTDDGSELKASTILDPSAQITNIRGMEYDPRGLGNTAWITTLPNGGGSSKIVKIALEDGPSSIGKAGVLSMLPTSLDFGNVDTGKSKTMHAQLRNSGDAPLTVSGLAVTPAGTAFSVGALLDPHLLNAGDTLGVDVTFAPIVGGSQSASLSVAKADGSSAFALTGVGIVHSSGVLGSNIPAGYSLDQNYPNPSGLATTIPFAIPVGGEVEIRLLDDLGRIIFSDEKYENAGDHEREIELGSIPNGTYLYELRVGGLRIGARKMTLLR